MGFGAVATMLQITRLASEQLSYSPEAWSSLDGALGDRQRGLNHAVALPDCKCRGGKGLHQLGVC